MKLNNNTMRKVIVSPETLGMQIFYLSDSTFKKTFLEVGIKNTLKSWVRNCLLIRQNIGNGVQFRTANANHPTSRSQVILARISYRLSAKEKAMRKS